jgi:hypothetical protein
MTLSIVLFSSKTLKGDSFMDKIPNWVLCIAIFLVLALVIIGGAGTIHLKG